MREIKFRAWLKYEDAMVRVTEMNMWADDQNSHYIECENIFKDEILDYPRSEIELMQYTGLKDINGKEIYEGDIVTCDRNINDRFDKTTFEVKFEPTEGFYGESKLGNTVYGEDFNSAKVVGNVHENPELLTKQV